MHNVNCGNDTVRRMKLRLKNAFFHMTGKVRCRHPLSLDLGGIGEGKSGYITVNLDPWSYADYWGDVTDLDRMGVADNSVDEIFLSHTFEHIDVCRIDDSLRHWLKKLKPGGRLKIRGPNIEYILALFKDGKITEEVLIHILFTHYPRILKQPLMVHKWAWTKDFLISILRKNGFVDVQEFAAGGWQFDLEWYPRYRELYIKDLGLVARKMS